MDEFKVERAAFKTAVRAANERVKAGAKDSFRRWGLAVMAQIKLSIASRFRRRSGSFARSFSVRFSGEGLDTEARFASTHKGARLQEYGGVVRPVRRRALAIPIEGSPAMTMAGTARYGFSLYDTLPKATHTFWVKREKTEGRPGAEEKSRAVLMGRAKGSRTAKPRAWYTLVKSARIPPRLRMRETVRRAINVLKAEMAQRVSRG